VELTDPDSLSAILRAKATYVLTRDFARGHVTHNGAILGSKVWQSGFVAGTFSPKC